MKVGLKARLCPWPRVRRALRGVWGRQARTLAELVCASGGAACTRIRLVVSNRQWSSIKLLAGNLQ